MHSASILEKNYTPISDIQNHNLNPNKKITLIISGLLLLIIPIVGFIIYSNQQQTLSSAQSSCFTISVPDACGENIEACKYGFSYNCGPGAPTECKGKGPTALECRGGFWGMFCQTECVQQANGSTRTFCTCTNTPTPTPGQLICPYECVDKSRGGECEALTNILGGCPNDNEICCKLKIPSPSPTQCPVPEVKAEIICPICEYQ